MRKTGLRIICLLVLTSVVAGQMPEITLIYPRLEEGDSLFIYEDNIDSTFVFGHVQPPAGSLIVNGQAVPYTDRGAFLVYLPLRRLPGTKSWSISLINSRGELVSLEFPYIFASDLPPDSFAAPVAAFPCPVRVVNPHARVLTAIGGRFLAFMDSTVCLTVVGWDQGHYQVEFSAGFQGVFPQRFVEIQPDTVLTHSLIGDGECSLEGEFSICRFEISGSAPFSTELSPDGRTLEVTFYGATAMTDRIRYDSRDDFLREIIWQDYPYGAVAEFRCRDEIRRGYDINFEDGSVRIRIRQPLTRNQRTIRDKIIVVDAGHGGEAKGAVGPLGTEEKDVTLRWSKILSDELRRRGAVVIPTRTEDTDLGLYKRVELAESHGADLFVSLHANALPDGENPFLRRGTGTYYYHSGSRQAARTIHRHLLKASKLRDDGIFDANFAVVRPTAFPAVLLEAAYLMHPEEEELLLNDDFLKRLSRGVANGIHDYFRN